MNTPATIQEITGYHCLSFPRSLEYLHNGHLDIGLWLQNCFKPIYTQAATKKGSLSAHSSLLSWSHFSGCIGSHVRTVLSGWFSAGSVLFWLTALPHKHQFWQKGDGRDAQPGGKTELNCPFGYQHSLSLA